MDPVVNLWSCVSVLLVFSGCKSYSNNVWPNGTVRSNLLSLIDRAVSHRCIAATKKVMAAFPTVDGAKFRNNCSSQSLSGSEHFLAPGTSTCTVTARVHNHSTEQGPKGAQRNIGTPPFEFLLRAAFLRRLLVVCTHQAGTLANVATNRCES